MELGNMKSNKEVKKLMNFILKHADIKDYGISHHENIGIDNICEVNLKFLLETKEEIITFGELMQDFEKVKL